MTRHMSGPLREKAGWLLLGLFSLRDHVPSSVTSGTSQQGPLSTPFMPSLAGMSLVYLLWPAARVKGTFCSCSGRGHLRAERCAEVLVAVETIQEVGPQDEQLKELRALHVRGNV